VKRKEHSLPVGRDVEGDSKAFEYICKKGRSIVNLGRYLCWSPPEQKDFRFTLKFVSQSLPAVHWGRPRKCHAAFFCSRFHFAHRARCAAAILRRAATDSGRLVRLAEAVVPFTLAQRARCAAAIRVRPAAEILRPPVSALLTPVSAETALLRLAI
jgi:hypothetical protein